MQGNKLIKNISSIRVVVQTALPIKGGILKLQYFSLQQNR